MKQLSLAHTGFGHPHKRMAMRNRESLGKLNLGMPSIKALFILQCLTAGKMRRQPIAAEVMFRFQLLQQFTRHSAPDRDEARQAILYHREFAYLDASITRWLYAATYFGVAKCLKIKSYVDRCWRPSTISRLIVI